MNILLADKDIEVTYYQSKTKHSEYSLIGLRVQIVGKKRKQNINAKRLSIKLSL